MSVATEFPPIVHIPERARTADRQSATVLPFRRRAAGVDVPASVGPSRIGPSRIGPSRIGPSRIGSPGVVGPSRMGPSRMAGPYARHTLRQRPSPAVASSAHAALSLRTDPAGQPARLRITRRGYAALGALCALVAAALLWLAHASAPAAAGTPAIPAAITVQDGDTLWSISSRLAPQRDPRDVVADLERINHLPGPALTPGQVLRVR